ncbi:MAG: hypothetical protein M1838_002740 [Thelocarpon superellum]|nr:MAG: hypothetical protein M1838_002740 [Thelocarpon superellum]
MTTLVPRPPYTPEELRALYPSGLRLELVQVLLRHGERSPVSTRFRNAGLPAYWPYCAAARHLSNAIMTEKDASRWDKVEWRRRLETFGRDDGPVIATGPRAEVDSICNLGELTDKGRQTTLALGQRLRHLYVDQLGYMPKLIADADMIYLRATPIPRALESVQQSFWGMYPPSARTMDFPTPTIVTRTPAEETLYPNDGNCRRLSQLSSAFAQRTADRWNQSSEMDYLHHLMGKWMASGQRVAIDAHPRLSGVMDTVNSTLAHGPETRLPREFYDAKGRDTMERIEMEEWFSGYRESVEYRKLGIGSLMGDVVSRMVGSVEGNGSDGLEEIGGDDQHPGLGRGGEQRIKFAMAGCHDTTLAAVLGSLGALDAEKARWPPYTSHIAVELFRAHDATLPTPQPARAEAMISDGGAGDVTGRERSLWQSLVDRVVGRSALQPGAVGIGRQPLSGLPPAEQAVLDGYFVRLRYNDAPIVVPGCQTRGKHLEGDESFCTLAAFKNIVDKYTPRNWKQECGSNLDQPPFPPAVEPAGI